MRLAFLLCVCFSLASLPSLAQERDARARVSEALALTARGDTAAALAALRNAVQADPGLAEAHYEIGRLLVRKVQSGGAGRGEREAAQLALMKAAALEPDNPRYLAELATLRDYDRLTAGGKRVIDDLLERMGEAPIDSLRAEIEYNLGLEAERGYESYRDRRLVPPTWSGISTSLPESDFLPRYVEWYLGNTPPIEGFGTKYRESMLEHYRAALRYNPTHLGAASRLLVELLDEHRLPEYLAIARRMVDAHPGRPEALLYLGLGLHASGREAEAGEMFQRALAAMPEEERAPLLDLAPVLRRRPAEKYQQFADSTRARYEEMYWRLSDPLFLTEAHERRLEHMSRVAYADLRFSAPATGLRGWETDRGVTFIRYGPPQVVARYPGCDGPSATTIVWVYYFGNQQALNLELEVEATGTGAATPAPSLDPTWENSAVFMFCQTRGYFHARFAGDYRWVADEVRYAVPASYQNIPSISVLLPLPVQIARFRGATPDEAAVEVHSELPLELLAAGLDLDSARIETGVFLLNLAGERVTQQVDTESFAYRDARSRNPVRSWRFLMPAAGTLVAAVEARDANTWRAAAVRDTFTAETFPDDSLALSDILLADALRTLTAKPEGRADYDIAVNAARQYVPEQPVVIYYELYGLDRDHEGFSSYEVSLSVKVTALNREGTVLGGDRNPLAIIGLLADAWGFSAVGDDRIELRFSRELDMKGRDRAAEYHSLDLQRAPAGNYEITLQVWDNLGQQLAKRTRSFTVIRDR
ncbi:MAG: GWxTD domain-containing protein [Gemmatimonadales bacterium]|jgi:GWxTD domain-containing protein